MFCFCLCIILTYFIRSTIGPIPLIPTLLISLFKQSSVITHIPTLSLRAVPSPVQSRVAQSGPSDVDDLADVDEHPPSCLAPVPDRVQKTAVLLPSYHGTAVGPEREHREGRLISHLGTAVGPELEHREERLISHLGTAVGPELGHREGRLISHHGTAIGPDLAQREGRLISTQ